MQVGKWRGAGKRKEYDQNIYNTCVFSTFLHAQLKLRNVKAGRLELFSLSVWRPVMVWH